MNFIYALSLLMIPANSVFAQEKSTPAPSSGFSLEAFLPMMIVMFVVIYFFMIRPEQKKQKDKKNMISAMKKGDKVLTVGGIYGTVGNIKDDSVMLKISENTSVKMTKSAISSVLTKEGDKDRIEEKKSNG